MSAIEETGMHGRRKDETTALPMEAMYMLDQCALIETRCADLYRHFARLSDDRELETLWKKTALEEDHHALQFKMLSRLKGEGVAGVHTDASTIAAVLKKLEALFDKVKTSRMSQLDMLRLGVKLEGYLDRFHANVVIKSADKEMKHLLDSMMDMDREHVEMLQRALERLQKRGNVH